MSIAIGSHCRLPSAHCSRNGSVSARSGWCSTWHHGTQAAGRGHCRIVCGGWRRGRRRGSGPAAAGGVGGRGGKRRCWTHVVLAGFELHAGPLAVRLQRRVPAVVRRDGDLMTPGEVEEKAAKMSVRQWKVEERQ